MQDFKNLRVWQKSHELVLMTYAETAKFPAREAYGLSSQARRAAISIAANIAEGSSHGSDREFARFLRIAAASSSEVEYFSILAADLGFLDKVDSVRWRQKSSEVRQMLSGLLARMKVCSNRRTQ